jgi:monoamine oxidase
VKRTHATRWNHQPWTLGAASVAGPGGQPSRKVLTEPLRERVWFAGEAAHETLWGTVGGAWESGERAAEAVLKSFTQPARPESKRKPARRRDAGGR